MPANLIYFMDTIEQPMFVYTWCDGYVIINIHKNQIHQITHTWNQLTVLITH